MSNREIMQALRATFGPPDEVPALVGWEVVKDAIALTREDCAKWHGEQADMNKAIMSDLATRGDRSAAKIAELLVGEHLRSAARLRERGK